MEFIEVAVPAPLYPFDRSFEYKVPSELSKEIQEGCLVEINFARRKTWGLVLKKKTEANFDPKKIVKASGLKINEKVYGAERITFLKWLSEYYYYPIGEVVEGSIPAGIRNAKKNILEKTYEKLEKLKFSEATTDKHVLNEEQERAFNSIKQTNDKPHLLWGVTGSGKTEVYLQLIEECIKNGKEALLLIPEIALTPQFQKRFEERFPGQVAMFHSNLKPTALRLEWLSVLTQKKKIVMGARSALFAPQNNLGLIIVDEEHDSSYKQEERLRYHARRAALRLGKEFGATVVLGTATPSAETLNSALKEEFYMHKLSQRAVALASLPKLEIYDLKKNQGQKNMDPERIGERTTEQNAQSEFPENIFLSPALMKGIRETLEKKQQAILFFNRRGMGKQCVCFECGSSANCPSCQVTLKPHKNSLLCHYCAFEWTDLSTCPECKSKEGLKFVGFGTEALEEEISFHFPESKVLRLDRDSTSRVNSLETILADFTNKKADILIGTQMVAKGHDFPNVTFVGIICADVGMQMPDFRANERSLQLLSQVAGRAGRDKEPGHVLIQSFQPENPLFDALPREKPLESYQQMISTELEIRQALGYPPYSELLLLRLDSLDETLVNQAANAVCNALSKAKADSFQILGPSPSPLYKLRNRYRVQIMIKIREKKIFEPYLQWLLEKWFEQKLERKYKSRLLIDADPVSMM